MLSKKVVANALQPKVVVVQCILRKYLTMLNFNGDFKLEVICFLKFS